MVRIQVWLQVAGEEYESRLVEVVPGQPINLAWSGLGHPRVVVVIEPEEFKTQEVEVHALRSL